MKFMNKRLLIIASSMLIVAVSLSVTVFMFPIKSYWVAYNFLKNVEEDNYEGAFQSVYYYNFDGATDVREPVPKATAEKIWIDRVQKLKDKGVYLKSFSNLRVSSFEGGMNKGTVKVTMVENGKESVYLEIIKFSPDGKKVEEMNSEKPQSNTVELALAGNLADIDLTYLRTHIQPGITTRKNIEEIMKGHIFLSPSVLDQKLEPKARQQYSRYYFASKKDFDISKESNIPYGYLYKNGNLNLELFMIWSPDGNLERFFLTYKDRKDQMYSVHFYIGGKDRTNLGSVRVVD